MDNELIQAVIDRAVKIATKAAMNGNPVGRILWLQPATASEDWIGSFLVEDAGSFSASEKPPWE